MSFSWCSNCFPWEGRVEFDIVLDLHQHEKSIHSFWNFLVQQLHQLSINLRSQAITATRLAWEFARVLWFFIHVYLSTFFSPIHILVLLFSSSSFYCCLFHLSLLSSEVGNCQDCRCGLGGSWAFLGSQKKDTIPKGCAKHGDPRLLRLHLLLHHPTLLSWFSEAHLLPGFATFPLHVFVHIIFFPESSQMSSLSLLPFYLHFKNLA